jgi:hypothetical protein
MPYALPQDVAESRESLRETLLRLKGKTKAKV